MLQADEATGVRKNLLSDAIDVAEQWSRARQTINSCGATYQARYNRGLRKNSRSVRGQARQPFSGASPLNEKLAHLFTGIGLEIYEVMA